MAILFSLSYRQGEGFSHQGEGFHIKPCPRNSLKGSQKGSTNPSIDQIKPWKGIKQRNFISTKSLFSLFLIRISIAMSKKEGFYIKPNYYRSSYRSRVYVKKMSNIVIIFNKISFVVHKEGSFHTKTKSRFWIPLRILLTIFNNIPPSGLTTRDNIVDAFIRECSSQSMNLA